MKKKILFWIASLVLGAVAPACVWAQKAVPDLETRAPEISVVEPNPVSEIPAVPSDISAVAETRIPDVPEEAPVAGGPSPKIHDRPVKTAPGLKFGAPVKRAAPNFPVSTEKQAVEPVTAHLQAAAAVTADKSLNEMPPEGAETLIRRQVGEEARTEGPVPAVVASGYAQDPQEAAWIAAAKSGDMEGFGRLYERYSQRIHRLILRMTGNPDKAEDFTHDAFAQALKNIRKFQGNSSFHTWLHRIAVNVVLMDRRKKKLPEVSVDRDGENQEGEGVPWEIGAPDRRLEASPEIVDLEKRFRRLSPRDQTILRMFYEDGHSTQEIAGALGTEITTVKARLNFLRRKLYDALH